MFSLKSSLRSTLMWFLYGTVSRSTLGRELVLVGAVFAAFVYLEKDLLLGKVTYIHDSILWYPMFHYFAESLWNGFWPFWNPYVHGGEPFHYAWGILRLLDPVTLLMVGLGKLFGVRLFDLYHYNYVVRILVTMVGLYAVFRHLLRRFLSLYIVLIVGLWGHLGSVSLTAVGALDAFCWFPWAFFCWLRTLDQTNNSRGAAAISFSYFLGIQVGASIYHWAFPIFVLTLFAVSLLINRRDDLKQLLCIKRKVWFASLTLFLLLAAPLISLAPERPEIIPTVRLYDRDQEPSWLTRVLGVQYRDIEYRSPQVGLGSYQVVLNLFRWLPHYETPETSYVARSLLIVGLLFGLHQYKYNILSAAIVSLFLYAGPVWPFGFLHKLLYFSFPPLWLARHLSIFDPFIYFFVLFFIGLGTDRVLSWLSWGVPAPSNDRIVSESPAPTAASNPVVSQLAPTPLSVLRLAFYAVVSLAAAAGFYWILPLHSNVFFTLYTPQGLTRMLLVTLLCWVVAILLLHPVLRHVKYAIPLLLAFSILVIEQWTIGSYFHRPGVFSWEAPSGCGCVKQTRTHYFDDFQFPRQAASAFPFPDQRVAGLNLKRSYFSYGPTLLKVNTALEDLLPPRMGGPYAYLGAFRIRFPAGLYHFWPRGYFRLYEIGESRPSVFADLMGIGRPMLEFYPRFIVMNEGRQETFFGHEPVEQVHNLLDRAVFLLRNSRGSFTPLQLRPEDTAEPIRNPCNGSFEEWTANELPWQWSYSQGGTGGRVERAADKKHVKEGKSAEALVASLTESSSMRYTISVAGRYQEPEVIFYAWAKSSNTVPAGVQLDVQPAPAKGRMSVKWYGNSGRREEITIRRQIESNARYTLVTLSVSPDANAPPYFDDVRGLAAKPLETSNFNYKVVSYVPSRVELDVDVDRSGILLFRDNYHPSWLAFVDGVPTRLETANLAFKAVPLGKGRHRVIFEYRPLGFLCALYAYLAANGLFLIVAGGLRATSTMWKSPQAPPPGTVLGRSGEGTR